MNPTPSAPRPAHLGAATLVVALVTGALEAAILMTRRGLGYSIWAPADIVWTAPLSYLALALPLAAVVFLIAWLGGGRVGMRWLLGPVIFAGALVVSTVLFGGSLHAIAHHLLALGVTVAILRRLDRPGASLHRAPWLAAGLAGVALVTCAGMRRAAARPTVEVAVPAARPAGAWNVLLLVWDTVRGQNTSLLGYRRPTTPQLERWARRGVVFEQALSTAPWTLGSHGGMFTGVSTQELGAGWRTPLVGHLPTLAEQLSARGYRTAGIVANLVAASRESGLARGFQEYDDFPRTWRTAFRTTLVGQRVDRFRPFFRGAMRLYPPRHAPEITRRFLDWEARVPATQPWFVFLNYFDAHDPYFPGPAFRNRWTDGNRFVDRYDAAIATLDADLDQLLTELERRGELDRTLVILTSDHGELFGEHGLHQHGNSLYLELLHVPLVLLEPTGAHAGQRVTRPVSLASLPATVMDLVQPGTDSPFPGEPLGRILAGDTLPLPDTLLAGAPRGINTPPNEPVTRGNMSALHARDYHYIRNGDGAVELYHLPTDPAQQANLATAPEHRAARLRLDSALARRVPPHWHADTAPGAP